jgi:hypothetical protein
MYKGEIHSTAKLRVPGFDNADQSNYVSACRLLLRHGFALPSNCTSEMGYASSAGMRES